VKLHDSSKAGFLAPAARTFADPASLAATLASEVASRLREGVSARGGASLVLSGGRTPAAFFEALSQSPLDWARVWVTLADERRVAPSSPDSNERMVRAHLLQGAAAAARFVPLFVEGEDEATLLRSRAAALAAMPRPFDVLVLGMGEDGHTASLFPAAEGLARALDPLAPPAPVAITPPAAPHARVSMNLAMLLGTRWIALHVQGATKPGVIWRATAGAAPAELPISAILLQGKVPVDVFWAP
jgi:6-phosphogluconolactonase